MCNLSLILFTIFFVFVLSALYFYNKSYDNNKNTSKPNQNLASLSRKFVKNPIANPPPISEPCREKLSFEYTTDEKRMQKCFDDIVKHYKLTCD